MPESVKPGLVETQGMLTDMNEKINLGLNIAPIKNSITGMIRVIDQTGSEDSGVILQWFFQWTGDRLDY